MRMRIEKLEVNLMPFIAATLIAILMTGVNMAYGQEKQATLEERVVELERITAGMQKQITILHGIEKSQDVCSAGQEKTIASQGVRIGEAEKKITHIVNILKLQH